MAVTRILLHRQSSESVPLKPASEPNLKKTNSVHYRGVSFIFDPSLAIEVKSETIPALMEGKPSDIVPEHSAFTLTGYGVPKGKHIDSPQIRVFEIAKFREAMHHGSQEMRTTYPPTEDWAPSVDEEVRVLKALIAERPGQQAFKTFISKVRDRSKMHMGNGYPQMPFLPTWEATQAFVSHVGFKNGRGVLFLTQWNNEASQVTNEGLEYAFQGITEDGQHYISAEFSVIAPFLPTGLEPEVVAWDERNYLLLHRSKKYQSYLRPVLEKLEALPADQFRPNLILIEKLVESLQIDNERPHQQ